MRELAAQAQVSNAYLSQIERGLHEPWVRVLRALANALQMPPDRLLAQAGLLKFAGGDASACGTPGNARPGVDAAIHADTRLPIQKQTLIAVYRSYLDG